ncbi:OPT family oligopeptide transporter [Candidatus Palauibacter sp.]|uniref:OPT family oligopeptide transporter n=1 Tax=Candidatus Palauibacter sp. TaxID=3101350 RepID=UPI003AF2FF28
MPDQVTGTSNPRTHEPYIPASQSLPEITGKAIVLGILLSAVLAGANAYLGLKVGLTVSASIPAAVISMAILRMFREHNILENNIVQTAASAGESLAAGVIFTLPALILLRHWAGFPFLPTMGIALCGGILGVLFTIPLRRALIIEADLRFPEGVATAEVLKAGATGGSGAKLIAFGGVAAALLKLSQTGFKIAESSLHGAVTAGRSIFGIGTDLSPALLGVGYIVGPRVGSLVLAGGAISWLIAIPIYLAVADPATVAGIVDGADGYGAAQAIWSAQIRFMGVGAMVVGGVWALVSLLGAVRDGVRSSVQALRASRAAGGGPEIPRTERDMPINLVAVGTVSLAVPILAVFVLVVDRTALGITPGLYWIVLALGTVFALLAGFLFASVAGYMAGLVGSSNNPISGVTIATILTISLILYMLLGLQIDFTISGPQALSAAATAILVGAVVACAAAIAGDNMQDLKAGRIVGATPRRQQIMQVIGVVAAALVIAPILGLLYKAYGFGGVLPREGMDPNEMLQAPQATLMASVADGVFSQNLPWAMIGIGALIAASVIALDQLLKARGSSLRVPVLAVAVGIYLPIELEVPIFVGGVVAWLVSRSVRRGGGDEGDVEKANHRGLLFASGLITGEALVGILLAIPFAATQSTDVLSLAPDGFGPIASWIGAAAAVGFTCWLYRISVRSSG